MGRCIALLFATVVAVCAAASISAGGIGNAASYQSSVIAPGEIVVTFGSGLGPDTLVQAAYGPDPYLPTTVAETQVFFDATPAPIVYASGGQVAAIVPYGLKDSTAVKVRYRGVDSNVVRVPVAAAVPGIFTCPDGTALVLNFAAPADARNSCGAGYQTPKPGDPVTVFVTGAGDVSPAIGTGQYPGTVLPRPVQGIAIQFGGVEAQPCPTSFAGMIYAGVLQVNTCVPPGVAAGSSVPVTASVGEASSTAPATPMAVDWKLVWSDEFDGAAGTPPDPAKWAYDLGNGMNGWGNHEWEIYTDLPENAAVDGDGNLAIRTLYRNGQYTSARLKTLGKFEFQYGRVEARIKLPYATGIWPAFWMMGDDFPRVGAPLAGEIDIMEYIGSKEPDSVFGNVHAPVVGAPTQHVSQGSPYAAPPGRHFYDEFHVYGVEWSVQSIKLTVDGNQYQEVTPYSMPAGVDWVFQHPFFMLLNVAVGGWPGDPDPAGYPQTMLVDWVRVSQLQ